MNTNHRALGRPSEFSSPSSNASSPGSATAATHPGSHRPDAYRGFADFIASDIQAERSAVNRKMMHVFFFCFLLPTLASAAVILLSGKGVLPREARGYVDWLILVFPIGYSVYHLATEAFRGMPLAFRRGGVSLVLARAVHEGERRERICEALRHQVSSDPHAWAWVARCFSYDLQALQDRNRYLTALAGAVLFLIMQGIDSLGGGDLGSPDFSQFVGLSLFLGLLYLSGSQTHVTLKRYLSCAELLAHSGPSEARKN